MAEPTMSVPGPRSESERKAGDVMPIAHLLPGPVHYAMAGGGAHGAVQWGLLQALAQTDLRPDMIIGTSAGALTGAIVAEDLASGVNRIAYVWGQLTMRFLIGDTWLARRVVTSARQAGLVPNDTERDTLESILEARTFADLEVPFGAVTTDLAAGTPVVHTTGDLIEALLASSAIPGVLPPVEIDGRLQVDGLASANLPAVPAVEHGAGTVMVLDTGSKKAGEVGTTPTKVLGRVGSIMAGSQRRGQLRAAATVAPVVLLPTPNDLSGTLDFRDTMSAGADGYRMARAFLARLAERGEELTKGLYLPADNTAMAEDLADDVPVVAI